MPPTSLLLRFVDWILRFFLSEDTYMEKSGDLVEAHTGMREQSGSFKAGVWLLAQYLKVGAGTLRRTVVWRYIMFNNYLKLTLRSINKHKVFSFLNIYGLTIGLMCFMLIFLFIRYELSFDSQHSNADRIYMAVFEATGDYNMGSPKQAHTHPLLAPTLKNEFPEVENATRFSKYNNVMVSMQDKKFLFDKWVWADEFFFDVFDIRLISGDRKTALDQPFSVVIDEDTAHKLFGFDDPLGKELRVVRGRELTFQVTGVMQNLPANSHFRPQLLGQYNTQNSLGLARTLNSWSAHWFHSYLLLREGIDMQDLETKIQSFIRNNIHPSASSQNWTYRLLPMMDIHLKSTDILKKLEAGGDIRYVYICSVLALFILAVAGINFVNLSTARSLTRSREISIRKVVGAHQGQLMRQFMSESQIFTILSLGAAVGLVLLTLRGFSHMIGREITGTALLRPGFILGLLTAAILTGLFSGFYPALYQSRFRPAALLKGALPAAAKGLSLRNGLVVFQFAVSLFLIISTIIISGQLRLIRTKKLGFDREHIVVINISDNKIRQARDAIKNELLQNPGILGATFTQTLPININWGSDFEYEGRGDKELPNFYYADVDYDYVDVFGMEITAGRNFSRERSTDSEWGNAFILNERAVQHLGWDDPIGKRIGFPESEKMGTVVGVVKDFHCHSLHLPAEPAVLVLNSTSGNLFFLSIKIRSENLHQAIGAIEEIWGKHSAGYPFEYYFLDAAYNYLYKSEMKLSTFFRLFSLIAITISCLGLLGLAAFTVERRTKEIGIRKVLGATVPGIILLVTKGFTKWVLLANIVAWPAAYFAMSKWLEGYAYRIDLSVWTFLFCGVAVYAIALLTVGYQSIKAAVQDPTKSLRHE